MILTVCKSLSVFSLLILFSTTLICQTSTTLEFDKLLEREIKGGEMHSYQITLEKGKFAQVRIDQNGIDLLARVFELDGKLADSFDADIKLVGIEKPAILGETAGTYRLDVEVKDKTAPIGRYTIRFDEIRDLTTADKDFQESKILLRKVSELNAAGKYQDAIIAAEKSLAIREKLIPVDDLQIGVSLQVLANLYANLRDFQKSDVLFIRALESWKKVLPPDDYRIAAILHNLGANSSDRGDLVKAESYFLQALEIRKKSLGEVHSETAQTLNSLGITYRRKGDTAKSLKMYESALEIREKLFGNEHQLVAAVLQNLGSLHYYTGDYVKAESLFTRALAIREKTNGPKHPATASVMNNLALAYIENEKYSDAESLFRKLLAIRAETFGEKSIQYASGLGNLGDLYLKTKDYQKAEETYLKTLQIYEPLSVNDPIGYASVLSRIGAIYGQLRDFAKSESYLMKALNIYTSKYGNYNPTVGTTSNQLARMYALKGDASQAVSFQIKASAINELALGINLNTGSERQKLAFISDFSSDLNQAITIHTKVAQNNLAAENALTTILQRKGRVQDAMTDSLGLLRKRLNAEDQKLLTELNQVNSELAKFVLSDPNIEPAEREKLIETLREKKEKIESQISVASGGSYTAESAITLNKIRQAIPEKSTLLEFSKYQSFDLKTGERNAPSYVVYLATKSGEIKWAELGEAKPIDEAIRNFRQALQDSKSTNIKQLARDLDEKIISPIRTLFGNSSQLLISPDSELNLIPFEALIDKNGKYLVENYSISYLSSGRDLLKIQNSRSNDNPSMIFANPAFGEFATNINNGSAMVGSREKRRNVNVAKGLSETYFAPLSGTEQEGREIKLLFPDSILLTGEKANVDTLKNAASPKILHIATHGFYLEPNAKAEETENPLLRSGLAFAGANKRTENDNRGILTALESAGLNLFGTKLVVLSACGTGLGDIQTSEGVFGLRRSFVLAGSESLVFSLWSVSDYVTRKLMIGYYKNLKQGVGRGESLRKVQLEMIKSSSNHPFYWASFIQSGNWKSLENTR